MEKLVRDRIPEIIRATGEAPVVRVATEVEIDALLRAKLVEEVDEFLNSGDPEELADVLEVLLALAGRAGLDPQALEQLRVEKAAARGRFSQCIVWWDDRTRPIGSS